MVKNWRRGKLFDLTWTKQRETTLASCFPTQRLSKRVSIFFNSSYFLLKISYDINFNLVFPTVIVGEVGHTLMVDDGKVRLTVTGKGENYLDCRVEVAGKISNRKGVNTPDSILKISPLTPKDRSDLEYMLGIGGENEKKKEVKFCSDCSLLSD